MYLTYFILFMVVIWNNLNTSVFMLIPRFNKIAQLDIVHKPCLKIFLIFKIMIFLPYWS
jgi:hypothetical protein